MPTVLREGPYRFFFYSADGEEPQHVHVSRNSHIAKFWLDPVRLQSSGGLRRSEIRQVQQILEANREQLLEAWDEFFND